MRPRPGSLFTLGLVALVLGACAPATTTQGAVQDAPARAPRVKKVTAAVTGDILAFSRTLTPGSSVDGIHATEDLIHAGLANIDDRGKLRAQMAEAVPTLDNGLWKLFPDGRMETTWKIRPNAVWHDGTPFTAHDIVFTAQVGQDRDVGVPSDAAYRSVERIEAVDDRTVTVFWQQPFADAGLMFTRSFLRQFAMPLPKHLLEKPYLDDKPRFKELPYWSQEFVGLGPFKLRDFVLSSHFILDANDRYALGRPKIDTVEVRIITDRNTVITNVLAGAIDLTMGYSGISLDQGIQARDQWRDGRLDVKPANYNFMWAQFIDPNPPVMTNAQFRRALMHAIDRQQMVDTIMSGYGGVAHSILDPSDPDLSPAESRVVRYEYDPGRAVQMLGALGYTRGPDGMFRDANNQLLSVELRTSAGQTVEKATAAVANFWRSVGVTIDEVRVPPQRQEDLPYRATHPGFAMQRNPYGTAAVPRLHGNAAPRLENNWAGSNFSRYMNSEFDALIDDFQRAIPTADRVRLFGEIIHHMTDQLTVLPLFYDVNVSLISNRLQNVGAAHAVGTEAWNAELWDLTQ